MRAKTPALGGDGLPKEDGTTQDANGELLYLNPMTGQYEPAVCLENIRERLIQGNGQSYDFPKKHGNSHNYTSFLAQDKPYGPSRDNRNPILFQLEPTTVGPEPTDYVRHDGKFVLDAFDHGIRDFGDAIPLCLSTELEGHDIETYKRRNSNIALYDFIARMPRSYASGKNGQVWHDKPPRPGNISMRATRFRIRAGCLTWHEKGDSDAKNAAIIDLMPAEIQAKAVETNSTIAFRDLTKLEQHQCETATGKRPSKAKKAKRAQKLVNDQEDLSDDESMRPKEDVTMAVAKRRGSDRGRKRAMSELSTSEDEEVDQPSRKSRRQAGKVAPDVSDSEYEPNPRERPVIKLRLKKKITRSPSYRADAASASAFGEAIANAHNKLQLPVDIVDSKEKGEVSDLQSSNSGALTPPHNAPDYVAETEGSPDVDPKGVLLNLEMGAQLPKRHSKKRKASDALEQSIRGDTHGVEIADTLSAAHKTPKKLRRRIARAGAATSDLADDMRSATRDVESLQPLGKKFPNPPIIAGMRTSSLCARKESKQARRGEAKGVPAVDVEQLSLPEMQLLRGESQASTVLGVAGGDAYPGVDQPTPHVPIAAAGHATPESSHISTEVDFDADCEEFRNEVAAGITAGDCRYISPTSPEDVQTIAQALELSLADFAEKTGHAMASAIVKNYSSEPYVSQQRRMDAVFENERLETGIHDGESLYCLPYWSGGFENWRDVLDDEGMALWSKIQA